MPVAEPRRDAEWGAAAVGRDSASGSQRERSDSFHPTDAGQAGYARLVARELGVSGPVSRSTAQIR